ncbi:MAG: tRNA pseudouridine(38-40) synthase TruA [Planctomycetes bacterium]|nr:tRNA pseudouridine(38-40) synthase TruA [Planctomycetota bacterium]
MRSLKLTVAYDGTAYGGWQRQANRVTIQSELETALRRVTGEPVKTVASGRTDAGVHAEGQVVSLATSTRLTNDTLRRAVNACLPEAICVLDVQTAPDRFHAIRDAIRKRYRYEIQTGPLRDVPRRAFVWHVWYPLDVAAMRAAAECLVGRHDFSSFETAGSPRKTAERHVTRLELESGPFLEGERIRFDIEADGFLYNMVRNIVGSLVEVGRGRRRPSWIEESLKARDRRAAGTTAPPHGLCLMGVDY